MQASEHTAENDAGCTVNLLGGTCPVGSLCPVHACTEELCRCEDEPCPIPPGSIDRDLWWGYLCPALANIGVLKEAQRDLVSLGVNYAEAGRILSRVQSFYVDAAHQAAQRYQADASEGQR